MEMEERSRREIAQLQGEVQRITQETKGTHSVTQSIIPYTHLLLSPSSLSEHASAERQKFEHKIQTEREEERTFWSGKIDSKIEALFEEEKAREKMEFNNLKDESKMWLVSEVITLLVISALINGNL